MSRAAIRIHELEHELDAAIHDLSAYDREALEEAINKPAHSVFFDAPGVREKARVWCERVIHEDPTVKLRRFQKALKDLGEWYDEGSS
jgi:hypothetical protein